MRGAHFRTIGRGRGKLGYGQRGLGQRRRARGFAIGVFFVYERTQANRESLSFRTARTAGGDRGENGERKNYAHQSIDAFLRRHGRRGEIDGNDLREITRRSLRRNYGMVLQETWLKKGTVRENLCMGKPNATDEEIVQAAKAARAHGFIKRMEKGYDTELSEEGGGLSEGQKQLLCITRVMLCLPPMLILDEATSSIDTRTERKISEAFETLMQGRTTFIVAHRLSTIVNADTILVMENGSVVEQGAHEELLQRNGAYAQLYYAKG